MIKDPVMPDNVAQIRYDAAISEREWWRRMYFEEIKATNRMRRDLDCMHAEMSFVREQIGEEAWARLVQLYDSLGLKASIVLAGGKP